jgi:hypothetical protein
MLFDRFERRACALPIVRSLELIDVEFRAKTECLHESV